MKDIDNLSFFLSQKKYMRATTIITVKIQLNCINLFIARGLWV